MDKKCEFVNDGKKCQAYHIKSSKFCFIHAPEKSEQRKLALNKASEIKELYLPIEEGSAPAFNLPQKINLETSHGVKRAYVHVIRAAFAGGLDKASVGCLIYSLNGFVSSLEKLEMLQRLERCERLLKKMGIKIE